jgi:serine O-acetyltransferase
MKDPKIIKWYRVSRFLYLKRIPLLPKIIKKMIRVLFSAEIPFTCIIEKGVILKHGGLGVVIHDNAIIGKNTVIFQHVTIGGREERGYPTIGEGVYIGVGACILGGVSIGSYSKIGANAVVISDVEPYSTYVGVPAHKL